SDGKVKQTSFTGEVEGIHEVGGLIGELTDGQVTNSYACADVTGMTNDNSNIGGLIGNNYGTIENTYAFGKVTGEKNVGSLIGLHAPSRQVITSYWNKELTVDGI